VESSGFVIIDSDFRPIYANEESIKILGYPNLYANVKSMDGILTQKVFSFLPRDLCSSRRACAIQFQSGRRLYHCRAFVVADHWSDGSPETRIALLMERGLPESSRTVKQRRMSAGMYEDPFSFTPDPKYYQRSRGHNEVLGALRNLVLERRGVGVVLAQAGMGKTALLSFLSESLRNEAEIADIPGSFENNAELVRSVMAILGVKRISRNLSENLQLFEEWLLLRNRTDQRVVLICDNAQDLDAETIQNLSSLSELGGRQQKLLQIIFAGRQDLAVKLTEPSLVSISKRINVFCRLSPLDQGEVNSYVLQRLRIAGCNRQLFSAAALSSVSVHSRGVPLNINMICRHCLSMATGNNLPMIDERTVADSAYDLVLRTQPAGSWDDPSAFLSGEAQPTSARLRDRRGLTLVHKAHERVP
jgi:type II secretory pathway predicted ATPase ExeA